MGMWLIQKNFCCSLFRADVDGNASVDFLELVDRLNLCFFGDRVSQFRGRSRELVLQLGEIPHAAMTEKERHRNPMAR